MSDPNTQTPDASSGAPTDSANTSPSPVATPAPAATTPSSNAKPASTSDPKQEKGDGKGKGGASRHQPTSLLDEAATKVDEARQSTDPLVLADMEATEAARLALKHQADRLPALKVAVQTAQGKQKLTLPAVVDQLRAVQALLQTTPEGKLFVKETKASKPLVGARQLLDTLPHDHFGFPAEAFKGLRKSLHVADAAAAETSSAQAALADGVSGYKLAAATLRLRLAALRGSHSRAQANAIDPTKRIRRNHMRSAA